MMKKRHLFTFMDNPYCLGEKFKSNDSKMMELIIPNGAERFSNQIAGHKFGFSKHKFGILKHKESGDILKPIFDNRCKRERLFYETIFNEQNNNDICIRTLRNFVPHYNGIFHDDQMDIDYIRLEDVTANMFNVSILDIKIGSITYDPEATEEKRRSEMNKFKYAKELGFRILGMRIYNQVTDEYYLKDREFGREKVNPDNVSEVLMMFVQNNVDLLRQYINQLNEIENWFHVHNIDRWKFISSSLLFAYQFSNTKISDTNSSRQPISKVKMIDLAHVFPNQGIDENYLFGLGKLKQYLQKAVDSSKD